LDYRRVYQELGSVAARTSRYLPCCCACQTGMAKERWAMVTALLVGVLL
jgi:hypothetical protein